MVCPYIQDCVFLKANENKEELKTPMKGLKQKYCEQHNEECNIYKLAQEFEMNKIPSNLMPNGMPLTGTNDNSWDAEVKDKLREIMNKRG